MTIKTVNGLVTVALLLFLGLGTVSAQSNTSSLLSTWYQGFYNKEVVKHLETDFSNETGLALKAWEVLLEEKKLGIVEDLGSFGDNTFTKSKDEIENYQSYYVTRLEETKNELANKDPLEEYKTQTLQQVDAEMNEEVEVILTEMLAN